MKPYLLKWMLLAGVAAGGVWLFWNRGPEPAKPLETPPALEEKAAVATATPARTENLAAPTIPPVPPENDDPLSAPAPPPLEPGADVRTDLDQVSFALRDFHTALGENPVGSNAEITRTLLGENLKQVKIGVPRGSSVNQQGELVDRWQTPYFFHQLSRDKMEIRSAGPDRKMWTKDDVQM